MMPIATQTWSFEADFVTVKLNPGSELDFRREFPCSIIYAIFWLENRTIYLSKMIAKCIEDSVQYHEAKHDQQHSQKVHRHTFVIVYILEGTRTGHNRLHYNRSIRLHSEFCR